MYLFIFKGCQLAQWLVVLMKQSLISAVFLFKTRHPTDISPVQTLSTIMVAQMA